MKKRSKKVMIAAGAGASLLAVAAVGILIARTAHSESDMANKQGGSIFKDNKFHNLMPTMDAMKQEGMFKTMGEFMFGNEAVRVPTEPLPMIPRSGAEFALAPEDGLRITWLGHSTMLIEIDGVRVLTDPVWGERASPVGFAGPRRFHAPPLPLDELPPIDAVVISHDHYDHLDRGTIEKLAERVPLFVVPLRVGEHLRDWGVPADKIRELDWWQDTQVKELTLVCTPARHFSGRGLLDRDQTLWASWSMLGPAHRAYFSGDGGMSPSFAEIGEKYGPFDVTLLEVGAYHPNWADIHAGPEQAIQTHRDLRGKLMLPTHWGTFNLSLHSWTEPAERLLVAAEKQGVQLAIPKPGESVVPGSARAASQWWPELPWRTAEELPVVSSGLEVAPVAKVVPAIQAKLAEAER